MMRLFKRLIIAGILSLILSNINVKVDRDINQTLLAVLGIIFSISMSLLVSFNLSQVLNKKIRIKIRNSINHTTKMLIADFLISTIFFVLTAIPNNTIIQTGTFMKFDCQVFGMCVITISILYEVYNFKEIHNLNVEIEEKIIEETIKK